MSYIKVNHQKISVTADKIDDYISLVERNMTKADAEMELLKSQWDGADYLQVSSKWNDINSCESTTEKMKKALSGYADLMREASQMYKDAQARAINRADTLCK